MYQLLIHRDARGDLKDIRSTNSKAFARMAVFLEELQGNQKLLDSLTDHNFGGDRESDRFHVSKWLEQWKQGKNLWRLKAWSSELLPYRVVYAYIPGERRYHVLGIVPRDEFNYESSNPLTQRILRAYADL